MDCKLLMKLNNKECNMTGRGDTMIWHAINKAENEFNKGEECSGSKIKHTMNSAIDCTMNSAIDCNLVPVIKTAF